MNATPKVAFIGGGSMTWGPMICRDLCASRELRGMEVPGRSGCSKGSCWTFTDWDGERFARGEYHPNPS